MKNKAIKIEREKVKYPALWGIVATLMFIAYIGSYALKFTYGQWNENERFIMDTVHTSNIEPEIVKEFPGLKIRKKDDPYFGPIFTVSGNVPQEKALRLADWINEQAGGRIYSYRQYTEKAKKKSILPLYFRKVTFGTFPVLVEQVLSSPRDTPFLEEAISKLD